MAWSRWSLPTCQGVKSFRYPLLSVVKPLQRTLRTRGEFQTQKEAAWAISNLTISGNKTQVSETSLLMNLDLPAASNFESIIFRLLTLWHRVLFHPSASKIRSLFIHCTTCFIFQPSELQGHASDSSRLGRTEQHAKIGRAWCESLFFYNPVFTSRQIVASDWTSGWSCRCDGWGMRRPR